MGLYKRPRSPYWHIWLENGPVGHQRIKTAIRIGTTKIDREKAKLQAEQLYGRLLLEQSARVHRLDTERPVIRFAAFAQWYDEQFISKHKGADRERGILPLFVAAFGDRLVHTISRDDVIEWRTRRLSASRTVERYGSRLKGLPVWLRIHQYLTTHGPTPSGTIRAALELKGPPIESITAKTAHYFKIAFRGIWTAVGTPEQPTKVLPPPSASTVNREVALLKQIMSAAVPRYIDASPLAGLPDLPTVTPRRRTMTHEEEVAVLAQLGTVDLAIVLCGLDGLMRLGEILALRKADDHGELLHVVNPKNSQARAVPVSTRLRAALDALPATDSAYLFAQRRRGATAAIRRSVVAGALEQACKRAGVPYGRAVGGLTFHWSTRRTGATRMIRAGGDGVLAVVREIGGWETMDVLTDIYQEVSLEDMRKVVETVSAPTSAVPEIFADSHSAHTPAENVKKRA